MMASYRRRSEMPECEVAPLVVEMLKRNGFTVYREVRMRDINGDRPRIDVVAIPADQPTWLLGIEIKRWLENSSQYAEALWQGFWYRHCCVLDDPRLPKGETLPAVFVAPRLNLRDGDDPFDDTPHQAHRMFGMDVLATKMRVGCLGLVRGGRGWAFAFNEHWFWIENKGFSSQAESYLFGKRQKAGSAHRDITVLSALTKTMLGGAE